jgi:cell division protein FtsQ
MKKRQDKPKEVDTPEATPKPRGNVRVVAKPGVEGSGVKGARWHGVWDACKMVFGLALVLGSAGATAFGTYRFAVSSPRFGLHTLEVQTSRRMSNEELARAAGIGVGDNLFAIDLGAAEQKLLEDAWVVSVKMTRKLPDTLHIELEERTAVALAPLDSQLFLVDAAGEPFKRWAAGDPHDLPLITGLDLESIAKDRQLAVVTTGTALEVLEHYARLPVSKQHPAEEINVALDGSVVLTVGKQGIALHLGKGPWPKKLLMVAEVLKPFAKRQDLPGVVFLDNQLHPERVVVRMR